MNKKTETSPGVDPNVPPTSAPPGGLGYNGEFRIGAITIAPGDGKNLILRHEHVGTEKKVAEATIEGYLEDRFFTDKSDADTSGDLDK